MYGVKLRKIKLQDEEVALFCFPSSVSQLSSVLS